MPSDFISCPVIVIKNFLLCTFLLRRKITQILFILPEDPCVKTFKIRYNTAGCTNFPKPRSHLKILDTTMLACSKFYTEDPQISGATIPVLGTQATWYPGFVHHCGTV
jgi:hypothetical protein